MYVVVHSPKVPMTTELQPAKVRSVYLITYPDFLHHKARFRIREGRGHRPDGDRNDGSTMEGFSVSEADSAERTIVHSTVCYMFC
jgi:hypothetical protein